MAGSCYLFLGVPRRAQTALESAAHELQDGSKAQAIVLGNLGLAYLRQRKIEEAAAALQRAVDVVERTRGGGGLTIVFRAGRELQPWRSVPAAQEVSDRLLDLVAG
jgi:2-phospho-L-lactate guanylyltransferase (CobY/MobA/RfbA family)